MRVATQMRAWGPFIDVYLISEGFPERLLVFKGPDENGTHVLESVEMVEGVLPDAPSFTLDQRWVPALVDALTEFRPTKIDQTVLDMLAKETERVDKLIDFAIGPPQPPTFEAQR